jgi:cytochrome c551/c552
VRITILAALVLSAAAVLACGGAQPPPAPPTTDTSTDAGAAPGATGDAGAAATSATPGSEKHAASAEESDFDKLPKDKKAEVMMTKVVPNVGKILKEHDGKKFEKFGCASCHGPQKKDDPHKVLPKLTFSNGGFEKLTKSKPEMMKLMSEKVVPAMASALGEKPFDPATKQGFGCNGCHTVD